MKILAIRPLGDSAVTFDLAEEPGAEAAGRVRAAHAAVEQAIQAGDLPGAEEAAAAFRSLTLHYDPLVGRQAELVRTIEALLEPIEPGLQAKGRLWSLPCCYDPSVGIDLSDLSTFLNLPASEIVARHAAVTFSVHALGFLPGLPFLGELPAELARPRRREPRTQVPAGSVAIANRMCVIYPWESPGGWHIVGACPVPLFDVTRADPVLLSVGDEVRFITISLDRYNELRKLSLEGHLDLSTLGAEA